MRKNGAEKLRPNYLSKEEKEIVERMFKKIEDSPDAGSQEISGYEGDLPEIAIGRLVSLSGRHVMDMLIQGELWPVIRTEWPGVGDSGLELSVTKWVPYGPHVYATVEAPEGRAIAESFAVVRYRSVKVSAGESDGEKDDG